MTPRTQRSQARDRAETAPAESKGAVAGLRAAAVPEGRLRDHGRDAKAAVGTATRRSVPERGEPLAVCVERALGAFFDDLDGEPAKDLYTLVLDEVEAPLLRTVMRRVGGNQSRAAEALGLNRGTLRKKLKHHGLL